jgi:hypothetical protein
MPAFLAGRGLEELQSRRSCWIVAEMPVSPVRHEICNDMDDVLG